MNGFKKTDLVKAISLNLYYKIKGTELKPLKYGD